MNKRRRWKAKARRRGECFYWERQVPRMFPGWVVAAAAQVLATSQATHALTHVNKATQSPKETRP